MRIKIDECLPGEIVELLTEIGHTAETVKDEGRFWPFPFVPLFTKRSRNGFHNGKEKNKLFQTIM